MTPICRSVIEMARPSCGLGTRLTAFDLVLPNILAVGAIGDDEIAALGHGGILH
jgi:hypothetical protein